MEKNIKNFSKLTKIAYNSCASKYHELFKNELDEKEYDRKLLKEFSDLFSPGSTILDAGCGPSGHIGKYLHNLDMKVTGIDISDVCVSIASECNNDMVFLNMDMADLKFSDNFFDGIISFYSIIHAPKKHVIEYFEEFHRVLKPGGKLLVAVKSGEREEYLYDFLDTKGKIFFTHFKLPEIEEYFFNSGFRLLLLEERVPYAEEIKVKRIFALGEKV